MSKTKRTRGCIWKRPNGIYNARWVFNGRRYDLSTGKTDREEAEAEKERMIAKCVEDNPQVETLISLKKAIQKATFKRLTIADGWKVFEGSLESREWSSNTRRINGNRYGLFAAWAKGKAQTVNDITLPLARQFMQDLSDGYGSRLKAVTDKKRTAFEMSGKTYNDYLALLQQAWDGFIKGGYTDINPWTRDAIPRRKKASVTKEALSLDQLQALFAVASGEMRTLFLVGLYTGLRLKDCVMLKWEAVDLKAGFITVMPEKTKQHGIKVEIPILPDLREALQEAQTRRQGSPYVLPQIQERYTYKADADRRLNYDIEQVFDKAGIKTSKHIDGRSRAVAVYGFHSFRHTFITLAHRFNIPLPVVQAIVGHTSAQMNLHYNHESKEHLALAMNAFQAIPLEATGGSQGARDGERAAIAHGTATDALQGRLAAFAELLAQMDGDELAQAQELLKSRLEEAARN